LQHFTAPAHGFTLQVGQWHDGIDQPHIEGLLGIVHAAEEPDFAGLLLADDTRHVGSTPATIEGAHFRAGLAKLGVVGSDGQIAHHVQHVAATDGIASHHGHHGFRAGADVALEVEHVEVVSALVIAIATVVATDLLVAARAEGFLAKAGQDDGAHLIVITGIGQRLQHLFDRAGAKGIAHLGTVDGDLGNAIVGLVIEDIFVTGGAILPFNRCVEFSFRHCFNHDSSLFVGWPTPRGGGQSDQVDGRADCGRHPLPNG